MIRLIVCFLALCHVSLSFPATLSPPLALGRVELVQDKSHVRHGPFEYLSTMRKYNLNPTHPGALHFDDIVSPDRRLRRRDVTLGNVSATFELPPSYSSPLTVGEGESATTFNLIFDTGSADLWILSTALSAVAFTGNTTPHNLYNPASSTSAVLLPGDTFNISYADNSGASGPVYSDTVNLGGIVIKNQAIGAATIATSTLIAGEQDGLLGLSLQRNTIFPDRVPTFIQNFLNYPNLTERLFTCSLTRPKEIEPAFFTFGYIDQQLVGSQQIQYTNVNTEFGNWEVLSEFVVINGQRIERPGNTAILDTGTSNIFVSDDILPAIYAPLGGYYSIDIQGWVFPANVVSLPTIVLPVGNFSVTLAPEDMVYEVSGDLVYGPVQSRGDSRVDIFGDVWLWNVYAIYDIESVVNARFGFVPRNPSYRSTSSNNGVHSSSTCLKNAGKNLQNLVLMLKGSVTYTLTVFGVWMVQWLLTL